MHFVFCQISNKLINPEAGTLSDEYYESLYLHKEEDGYYRPEHFWELPLWIGEATYALSDDHEVSLHVITDVDAKLPTFSDFNHQPYHNVVYCFSVLDVNKAIIANIVRYNSHAHFAIGGYVNGEQFISDIKASYSFPCGFNADWYKSLSDLCYYYGTPYKYGVDWSLFENYRTIPRLTMSYGCTNKCSFCTVPVHVETVIWPEVRQQIGAMQGLDFKLVYLNDKTFGQSDNCIWLKSMYGIVKYYNPEFRGFIVQTTCAEVLRRDPGFWSNNHIVIVELGIETFNDSLLKTFNKPQNERIISKAVQKLSDVGIDTIANIVLGFPGENMGTYGKTLSFLYYFPFYALNVYTLALYENTALAELANGIADKDKNELATTRTFWSTQEQRTFDHIAPLFYMLGIDKVKA